jgi:hypothetical protein
MDMRFGICNKPIVALYEAPVFCEGRLEAVAGVADELLYGWICHIDEETGSCLQVTTEYGYSGYVRRDDMVIINDQSEYVRATNSRYIARNIADILSMPKIQGKVLLSLYRGSVVQISDTFDSEDGWVEVLLNNGSVGYINVTMLRHKEAADLPEWAGFVREQFMMNLELRKAIIKSATAYLGVQYRWGGKTPLGIDCSGLAFMSYYENGIFIFRDSQIKEGYPVKKIPNHMMEKGDLLYFPGHVAIYMGEGKYIHATAHRDSFGVVISSLYPWEKNFREDLYEKLYAVGSVF